MLRRVKRYILLTGLSALLAAAVWHVIPPAA